MLENVKLDEVRRLPLSVIAADQLFPGRPRRRWFKHKAEAVSLQVAPFAVDRDRGPYFSTALL